MSIRCSVALQNSATIHLSLAVEPVSLEELIPEDHLVRVIDLYVAKLDLGQLGFEKTQPKATGRPAYDPADQLKLYLYGYFQRIRSSRRLEAECQRNIEVMWLINRLKPDFKTIADFRKNNKAAFVATCRAFVQFCRAAGLIAGDLVAIDGSKFQAVASARRHLNLNQLSRPVANPEAALQRRPDLPGSNQRLRWMCAESPMYDGQAPLRLASRTRRSL